MISLDYQIVGFVDIKLHLLCDMTNICDEAKRYSIGLNPITDTIRTIMRNIKRGNSKITELNSRSFFHNPGILRRDFTADTIVSVYTHMNSMCCINRQIKILTHDTNTFHMICVVVSNKHILHVGYFQPIIVKSFFKCPYSNTGIY